MRVLAGCMEHSQLDAGRSLARAIERYLDIQGHLTERIYVNKIGVNIARQLEDRLEESFWLNEFGDAHRESGKVEKAIEYLQQALIINKDIDYLQGQVDNLNNLGLVYGAMGLNRNITNVMKYHQKSLAIAKEIGYYRGEAKNLSNLGDASYSLGRIKKATKYYQQALKANKKIGRSRGEAINLYNLGKIYLYLDQTEKAIEYIRNP
jgi:tetratricopeptide (TPR) repeat protein